MRVSYSEEENYPGQFDLWQANCKRSRQGKKGQVALRELKAALLAMPDKAHPEGRIRRIKWRGLRNRGAYDTQARVYRGSTRTGSSGMCRP